MRKIRGRIIALVSVMVILLITLSFWAIFADTDSGSEPVNIVVHTDWNFKLYNSFDSYAVDYNFVKDTDYTTGDDMTIMPVQENGYQSTTAITAKINTNANQDFTILPVDGKGYQSDFTGAKEFWVWVDFSNVLFRKMCFGFTGTDGKLYSTDDIDSRSDMSFYLENDEGGWKEMNFDTDGCMEFGNYKGFIRFSTDYFVNGTDTNTPMDLSAISGLKVWYNLPDGSADLGSSFTIDQVGFAGPSLTNANGVLGDFATNGSLILPSQLPAQTFDENDIVSRFGVLSDI